MTPQSQPDPELFVNPWPLEGEYDPNLHARVLIDMPLLKRQAVLALRSNRIGTAQIIGNILWLKLINALESHGITDFTQQSDFEQFIAKLRFVDGRGPDSRRADTTGSTTSGVVPTPPAPDVNRRETGVVSEDTKSSAKPSHAPSTVKRGGGRTSTGGGKGGEKKKVAKFGTEGGSAAEVKRT